MKDNIKSLTLQEWLNLIPCKLYNKKENKSYLITSFSKEGLYYNEEVQVENDDDFSWSPYRTIDTPAFLGFEYLTEDFIIGDEPTAKQVEWLERYNKMTTSMTKQEAWQIINKAVTEYRANVEAYNNKVIERYISSKLNNLLDADEIIGQCGGCYDDWSDE